MPVPTSTAGCQVKLGGVGLFRQPTSSVAASDDHIGTVLSAENGRRALEMELALPASSVVCDRTVHPWTCGGGPVSGIDGDMGEAVSSDVEVAVGVSVADGHGADVAVRAREGKLVGRDTAVGGTML